MNYLIKHWRGELALPVSYWVNGVIVSIIIFLVTPRISDYITTNLPGVEVMRFTTSEQGGWLLVLTSMIYLIAVWQLVGVWRAGSVYKREEKENRFWGTVVQVIVVISVLRIAADTSSSMDIYKHNWAMATKGSSYDTYSLSYHPDVKLIELEGGFGSGLSHDLLDQLKETPDAVGIVMNSQGGWVDEGIMVGNIISKHQLNTYTNRFCNSACAVAFLQGKERYVSDIATLGFHMETVVVTTAIVEQENKKDIMFDLVRDFGASEVFLANMQAHQGDGMFIPTQEILLEEGMINGVGDPFADSDVEAPTLTAHLEAEMMKGIDELEIYQIVKEHEPVLYEEMLTRLKSSAAKGGSSMEYQTIGEQILGKLLETRMPFTSNVGLDAFLDTFITAARALEQKDPRSCMAFILPEVYGRVDIAKTLDAEVFQQVLLTMTTTLKESYPAVEASIDNALAEQTIISIAVNEDIDFAMFDQTPQDEEGLRATCSAYTDFFTAIRSRPEAERHNITRYLLSMA